MLADLAVDSPRTVLDVGCGTGDIARRLAPLVDHLDDVDFSGGMIKKGKRLPGGDHPNLTWSHSPVEAASLAPSYALITAGESIHWMAWDVIFPRFAQVLTPRGVLAIVDRDWDRVDAVRERLRPIFARFSTNRDFRPYDLLTELEWRGLFSKQGEKRTRPEPWWPTPDDYVECRHSQNGFSRDRMGRESAATFDEALRTAVLELCRQGTIGLRDSRLQLAVDARIVWGKPLDPGR